MATSSDITTTCIPEWVDTLFCSDWWYCPEYCCCCDSDDDDDDDDDDYNTVPTPQAHDSSQSDSDDDDDTVGFTEIRTNPVYRPGGQAGLGLHTDDTPRRYSSAQLGQINWPMADDVAEEKAHANAPIHTVIAFAPDTETAKATKMPVSRPIARLRRDFDPEMEFCRNYSHKHIASNQRPSTVATSTMSSDTLLSMEASRTLRGHYHSDYKDTSLEDRGKSTRDAREVREAIEKMMLAINAETDLVVKRKLIQDYEWYKSYHDEFNEEDRERALFHLHAAHNATELDERLSGYQQAIMYTNNLNDKNRLRREYMRFCFKMRSAGTGTPTTTEESSHSTVTASTTGAASVRNKDD